MISDFKYALRTLAKTPGFTIIAVVTLALAIGANTAIFSLINDLFLRGLSFKEPRRVVHFFSNARIGKLVDLPSVATAVSALSRRPDNLRRLRCRKRVCVHVDGTWRRCATVRWAE